MISADRPGQVLLQPGGPEQLGGDPVAVDHGGELDEPDQLHRSGPLGGGLHRQPGLAAAAGAGQRHHAVLPQQLDDVLELPDPSDERGELGGQVVLDRVERPQRREVDGQPGRLELEQPLRPGQVAQTVVAEVDERGAGRQLVDRQPSRELAHQDLTAVGQPPDAGAAVECDTPIGPVGSDRGLTGVDRHADPGRHVFGPGMPDQPSLQRDRGVHRVRRPVGTRRRRCRPRLVPTDGGRRGR